MAITLGLGATTATTQQFTFADMGASGTIDLQISPRRDFAFCVAPVYRGIARATPYTVEYLNQDATYYARARTKLGDGTEEVWSNVVGFRTPVAAGRDLTVPAILIQPAIIMRPEPIIAVTQPGSTVAGFPGINVTRDAPVGWKSVLAGAHVLILEHAGAPIDTVAILNTNIPEANTVKLEYAAAAGGPWTVARGNAPFRATANMPGRDGYHGIIQLAAPIAARFWRITFNFYQPVNTLYVEHVVIGLNRKSKNHALEKTETPVNLGSKERTRTGTPDAVRGLKMRRVEFDLAWLTETQSETLYHEIGSWIDEPVFVVPNSKAGAYFHDRMLYGDLKAMRISQPSSLHFTRTLTVESLI